MSDVEFLKYVVQNNVHNKRKRDKISILIYIQTGESISIFQSEFWKNKINNKNINNSIEINVANDIEEEGITHIVIDEKELQKSDHSKLLEKSIELNIVTSKWIICLIENINKSIDVSGEYLMKLTKDHELDLSLSKNDIDDRFVDHKDNYYLDNNQENSNHSQEAKFDIKSLAIDDIHDHEKWKEYINTYRKLLSNTQVNGNGKLKEDVRTKLIVRKFQEMAEYLETEEGEEAHYRSLAYKYQSQYYRNNGLNENNLTFLGNNCARKILQMLKIGTFDEFVEQKNRKNLESKLELCKVYMVGPKRSKELIDDYGIFTVNQLKEFAAKDEVKNEGILSDSLRLGLKYFDHMQQKIPRDEVTAIVNYVTNEVPVALLGLDVAIIKEVTTTACGSYRRGVKGVCSDVDLVIKFPVQLEDNDKFQEFNSVHLLLMKILAHLEKRGVLKERISVSDEAKAGIKKTHKQRIKASYKGFIKLPDNQYHFVRRIDIKVYHEHYHGYGLLHFCGDVYFNKACRDYARKKLNMSLSDDGIALYVGKGKLRKHNDRWHQNCFTEEDIMDFLQIPYHTPKERAILDY